MFVQTVAKLKWVPSKDSTRLVFDITNGTATFFKGPYSKVPTNLIEGNTYIIKLSANYAKDEKGNDEKRTHLFLREIRPFNKEIPLDVLGVSVISGIITDIKLFESFEGDVNKPWTVFEKTLYRIKLENGQSTTYLWYDLGEFKFEKGDKVKFTVRLCSKRHIKEDGDIDNSEKYIYNDKPKWFTQLEILEGELVTE